MLVLFCMISFFALDSLPKSDCYLGVPTHSHLCLYPPTAVGSTLRKSCSSCGWAFVRKWRSRRQSGRLTGLSAHSDIARCVSVLDVIGYVLLGRLAHAVLASYFYWTNMGPLTRGSAAVGLCVLVGMSLACKLPVCAAAVAFYR